MNTVSSAHLGSSSPSQKAMKRARRPAKKALIANTTATTAGLSTQRTGAAGAKRGGMPAMVVETLAVIITPSSIVPAEGAAGPRGKGTGRRLARRGTTDRKSTRLNSRHLVTSYAVFGLKKKTEIGNNRRAGFDRNSFEQHRGFEGWA